MSYSYYLVHGILLHAIDRLVVLAVGVTGEISPVMLTALFCISMAGTTAASAIDFSPLKSHFL
jgi:peptidoglycan/LPS O-acetylase OafA/YrhL